MKKYIIISTGILVIYVALVLIYGITQVLIGKGEELVPHIILYTLGILIANVFTAIILHSIKENL